MEAFHAVGEDGFAAWCEAWNDGGRLLPRAPADLRHEAATLGLCERFASGPRERPDAVGALRRHFAFRQETRLALDLHVRPALRGRGLGGSLLAQLLARARELGAEVVRGYAPARRPRVGRAGRPPSTCMKSNVIAFSCWNWIAQLSLPTPVPAPAPWPASPPPRSGRPGSWRPALHAALGTSAPYVAETFAGWRARMLEAPGCGPETRARHARARRRAGGHLRAARLRRAARDGLPRVHGRGRAGARAGPRPGAQAGRHPPRARARGAPAGRRHESRQRRHAGAQRAARLRRGARRPQPRRAP